MNSRKTERSDTKPIHTRAETLVNVRLKKKNAIQSSQPHLACYAARTYHSPDLHNAGKHLSSGTAVDAGDPGARGRLGRRRKHVPEPQRLVPGARHHGAAVGGRGHVQHPGGVARQLLRLHHGRVLPQAELVLGEAVARQELLLGGGPEEGEHLAARVDRVEQRARLGVPRLDAAVRRAAAGGQRVALERAPREGLDGGLVLSEGEARRGGGEPAGTDGCVPEAARVVVAARGQHATVRRPAEATDLNKSQQKEITGG